MHFMRTSGPKEERVRCREVDTLWTGNVRIVCECQLNFFFVSARKWQTEKLKTTMKSKQAQTSGKMISTLLMLSFAFHSRSLSTRFVKKNPSHFNCILERHMNISSACKFSGTIRKKRSEPQHIIIFSSLALSLPSLGSVLTFFSLLVVVFVLDGVIIGFFTFFPSFSCSLTLTLTLSRRALHISSHFLGAGVLPC